MAIMAVAILPGRVMGQNTDEVSASASAKILTALNLTKAQDLHFGTITVSATLGTCVVSAAEETRSQTDGVTLLDQAPTFQRAHFTVSGDAGSTYAITLPTSDVTISSGSEHLIVNNFVHSLSGTTPTLTGGASEFYVGATLNVPGGQAAGLYDGSFTVTVAYN